MKYIIATIITPFLLLTLTIDIAAQEFSLETESAGLEVVAETNGVAVADYDLDGDLDVYFVAAWRYNPEDGSNRSRLMRNNGDGTFTDVTLQSGLRDANTRATMTNPGFPHKHGAAWGDYDNDGYPDIFLTNAVSNNLRGTNQLYHNNGDGTFTDVTQKARLKGGYNDHNSSAVWWDYDLDGDLDIYVCAWLGTNRMFRNDGDGVFSDVSEEAGLKNDHWTWVAVPLDANMDGYPDLYAVNDFGRNVFYLNNGDLTFSDATSAFGLEDEGNGMGVTVGDYNNDGYFDIYLTNIAERYPNPLFTNQGDGTFINTAAEMGVDDAGWAWGTEFFDCDHDGDLDLYVVTGFCDGFLNHPDPNYFFVNEGEKDQPVFVDKAEQMAINSTDESRGLAVFDHDNDGDLDLLVSNMRREPHLYINTTAAKNWLKIKLEGTASNRDAFGSIVRVKAGGATYYRYYSGVQFAAQNIMPVHFGLDEAPLVDEIMVRWPNGIEEKTSKVWVNQNIKIKEGSGIVSSDLKTTGPSTPETFHLYGNFPNPFNGSTIIEFQMLESGAVEVLIFNALGQQVASLNETFSAAGRHQITWNGINHDGSTVNSGLYVYQINFQNLVQYGKMLYVK